MTEQTQTVTHRVQSALAIGFVAAYLICFFSLDLPNSGAAGSRVSRLLMWQIAIGWTELTPPAFDAIDRVTDLGALRQRAATLGYATLIVLAAGACGRAVLCILGLSTRGLPPTLPERSTEPARDGGWQSVERIVLAFGIGTSVLSLSTLAVGLAGFMNRAVVMSALVVAALASLATLSRNVLRTVHELDLRLPWRPAVAASFGLGGAAVAMFLLIALLGAALPATDFDVREYHLQGPKEFYLAGRIQFLPHNVYANMPFGTETISLLGMIVAGDWWWGSLVGQVVLAAFAPMTALGVLALGRRLFSPAAGWFAALVYLTTPWIYRISIIPYTENALCYFLLAAALAMVLAVQQSDESRCVRMWLVAGLLAGSAAACKYTALTSTVLPLGVVAVVWPWLSRRTEQDPSPLPLSPEGRGRRTAEASGDPKSVTPNSVGKSDARSEIILPLPFGERGRGEGFVSRRLTLSVSSIAAVLLGVLLSFGPWLAKNAALTGNPVYPLFFDIFGGRNWTPEKNAKWEWGHRVPLFVGLGLIRPLAGTEAVREDHQHGITRRLLGQNFIDVTAQADWLSPLLFGLAPLALLNRGRRRAAGWLALAVGFLFFQWWLMTHRIDRFWVPLIPLVAVMAGAGATWTGDRWWQWFLAAITTGTLFFNFSYCTTGLCGDNRYNADLVRGRDPSDAAVNWMNQHLPADARVLAVGAADLFHLDRSVVYNTVFDDCIFEQLVRGQKPADAARRMAEQATHVYVNWLEIKRYRDTYGYSEFVTLPVFRELVAAGVLRPLWEQPPAPAHANDEPTRALYRVSSRPTDE
jgi:hypothetical protein